MITFVYLIEARIGVVKIGCGASPEQRLAAVHTHSPVLVRLIAKWPGSHMDERQLHKRFVAFRQQSEWFQIDGELLSFVHEVRGKGLDRILDWSEISYAAVEERRARKREQHSLKMRGHYDDPNWKLQQLCSMRQGRAEAKAFGKPGERAPLTAEQEMRRRALCDQVRQSVLASPEGRRLSALIAAQSEQAA